MKILWVKTDFLHPTTRGGQIRTLGILRELHRRNEIHYVAMDDGRYPDALARSSEYCSYRYPVASHVADRGSMRYFSLLASGAFRRTPVAIRRHQSRRMQGLIERLLVEHEFDSLVCDFLTPAGSIRDLSQWTLFQHNVETMIWRRLVERARNPVERFYLRRQAEGMREFEERVCRSVRRVIAVSPADAASFQDQFGAYDVKDIPTGVDVEYFTPARDIRKATDLVFVGSMDWAANVDGITYFVRNVIPLLRRRRPKCSLVIVGCNPTAQVRRLAAMDDKITVTGTVDDVRPYLWDARISIVPLHVGGGTRLKIYESLAARVPVVSTSIGAEGLTLDPSGAIRIADTPQEIADCCAELLEGPTLRERLADSGWHMVRSRFSWEQVALRFEQALTC